MAHIRGERFEIDLDHESVAPDEQPVRKAEAAATIPGFIGDVLEREPKSDVAPPSFKSQISGFPEHKKRTGTSKFKLGRSGADPRAVVTSQSTSTPDISVQSPSTPGPTENGKFEKLQIDAENKRVLAGMSAEEIEEQRQQLFSGLSPGLIEKLLKRSNIDDEPQPQWEPSSSPERKLSNDENRRPSNSERRVSFALPEAQIRKEIEAKEPTPTAARHSITSSPSPMLQAKFGSSTDVSDLELSHTSSSTSVGSRRGSSGHVHERKVSFVLPDYIEQARKASPTAAKHSVNSPSPMMPVSDKIQSVGTADITDLDLSKAPGSPFRSPFKRPDSPLKSPFRVPDSPKKSPKDRPSHSERKVSFALPDTEPETHRRTSTAAQHSISLSPSPRFVDKLDSVPLEAVESLDLSRTEDTPPAAEQGSVHFPNPLAAPELDPNSPSFLNDMHQKYFPNLTHDPSKLAWMQPATDEDNAAYDPSRENLDPKDVRFDFKGQIIPPSKSLQIPTDVGLHHHGDAPSAAGYTIAELGHLARSAFPAQRSIAIQTIGRILYRLGQGEFGNENDIDVVGPDGERAVLAKGLWEAVEDNRIIDTITEEADKDHGHQTSIALAQEAVWNWRKGGGRQRKAI